LFLTEFTAFDPHTVEQNGKFAGDGNNCASATFSAAVSTGRRNTLIFLERWSDQNEVSSPRIFHGQAEVGDLGQMATWRVDELDWSGV
jgi:hypothetical protein